MLSHSAQTWIDHQRITNCIFIWKLPYLLHEYLVSLRNIVKRAIMKKIFLCNPPSKLPSTRSPWKSDFRKSFTLKFIDSVLQRRRLTSINNYLIFVRISFKCRIFRQMAVVSTIDYKLRHFANWWPWPSYSAVMECLHSSRYGKDLSMQNIQVLFWHGLENNKPSQ